MYKNHVNNPLLGRVTKGEAVGNDEITSATFTGDGSADIIVSTQRVKMFAI